MAELNQSYSELDPVGRCRICPFGMPHDLTFYPKPQTSLNPSLLQGAHLTPHFFGTSTWEGSGMRRRCEKASWSKTMRPLQGPKIDACLDLWMCAPPHVILLDTC